MKLIDVEPLIKKLEENNSFTFCQDYDDGYDTGIVDVIIELKNFTTIDPIHAAGGCYCKECLHSEPVEYEENEGWVTPMDEYWCNEHKITMPLNGFCSEGRKDETK